MEFIKNEEKMYKFDALLENVRVIEDLPQETHKLYIKYKAMFLIASRDFVIATHTVRYDNGLIVTVSGSVEDARAPEEEKAVRGEVVVGGYALEPTTGGTRIIYITLSDLKG